MVLFVLCVYIYIYQLNFVFKKNNTAYLLKYSNNSLILQNSKVGTITTKNLHILGGKKGSLDKTVEDVVMWLEVTSTKLPFLFLHKIFIFYQVHMVIGTLKYLLLLFLTYVWLLMIIIL